MNSFDIKIDARDIQYGRFASMVLRTLKQAVSYRTVAGAKQKDVADRLGWHPTQLSRVLNGRVNNLSIKTVSDILWACDFDPQDITVDPIESIVRNHHCYFPISNIKFEKTDNNVLLVHGFYENPSNATGSNASFSGSGA